MHARKRVHGLAALARTGKEQEPRLQFVHANVAQGFAQRRVFLFLLSGCEWGLSAGAGPCVAHVKLSLSAFITNVGIEEQTEKV